MKNYVGMLLGAFMLGTLLLTGCGSDGSSGPAIGEPGTKDKDYDSNTQREFKAPDEFYDYGDYDYVKVIHLQDGTRCVLVKDNNVGGAGVDCDFDSDSAAVSTPTPSDY